MKTEVYSWRVSSQVKASLEREARRRKMSICAALDLAAREWLQKSGMDTEGDAGQQRLYKKRRRGGSAALASGDARRSESVSRAVRQRLRRRYGR